MSSQVNLNSPVSIHILPVKLEIADFFKDGLNSFALHHYCFIHNQGLVQGAGEVLGSLTKTYLCNWV